MVRPLTLNPETTCLRMVDETMQDWRIPGALRERIQRHLADLYGPEKGASCYEQLQAVLTRFAQRNRHLLDSATKPGERLSENDAILITYGDQISEPGKPPLRSLGEFLDQHLQGTISAVHILPFFPYSSDDGFSVINYTTVNPELGTWQDVQNMGRSFELMFDAVINHISAHSDWFQAFLRGDPAYADHFIVVEPGTDLSKVTRPRALPLRTAVQTPSGEKLVWTTFSTDQIDLNFANPQVLISIIEILLLYVENGAEIIRLDAIAYLWKEIGTPCIHLPQTHRVVQLFRDVLDAVAPRVLLITETNVPHEENISYFGDGTNEAQLVYQFPLAPLVLNAFRTGDARELLEWAAGLETPSRTTAFFNFTASHDGVGVRPVEGILDADAFHGLVNRTYDHGGFVSFKTNPDGTESPYELNISYFDALSNPEKVDQEGLETQISRFISSQAIMLALAGVPGIYVHSLLGSRSYHAGVERTGRYRTINREKLQRGELERELAAPTSLRHRVFQQYAHLLRVRRSQPAFHPNGPQNIILSNRALFSLLRTSPDSRDHILCIHSVSDQEQVFEANLSELDVAYSAGLEDLVTGKSHRADDAGRLHLAVAPYQVLWLKVTGRPKDKGSEVQRDSR